VPASPDVHATSPAHRSRAGQGSPGVRGTLVIGCGALAHELVELTRRPGFEHVEVACLPASLHNRPGRIPAAVRDRIREARGQYASVFVAYADCGTRGSLEGFAHLPAAHCFELYAGSLEGDDPGTYYLTDFLVRSFDRVVVRGLGLDRHPELRDDYFGHYTRVVWLAQNPTVALHAEAERAAELLGLPLEVRRVGDAGLEAALERLLDFQPNGEEGATC